MAKRRQRKRGGKGAAARLQARLKKRVARPIARGLDTVLGFKWAHSSIFGIGIAIGLALGLGLGIGLAWLDGRRALAPKPVVSAEAPPALPKTTTPATTMPATPNPQPVPPAYVEQTEPGPDELPPEPASPPPAVVENAPAPAPQPQPAPQVPAFTPAPQPAEPAVPSPALPAGETPAWLKNAVASIDPGNKPAIAIVLDDVGAAPADVAGAVALPAPVTLSIMTYAPNAQKIAQAAHAAGHEIMVHVPMEPVNRDADPGPNALLTNLSAAEIARRLDWGLAQFDGYVGINNHMGSKFTQNAAGMRVVLETLKARGLLFLDSRTIASSVGDSLAAALGVTHVQRDVFLDDVIDEGDIMKELARAETIATKHGFAVAIGHPHPDTVEALRRWIPEARARGFVLVPLTTIAKKQNGVTG